MVEYPLPPKNVLSIIRRGVVIPPHPLALTKARKLDEVRQQVLTRYYVAAGAGGIAIGAHVTQFAIHDPRIGLYEPVLKLGAETIEECKRKIGRPLVKIAGIRGSTKQAVAEAKFSADMGYHIGLLDLSNFKSVSTEKLIFHCRKVAEIIPIFGFYLQSAVGGRTFSFDFWRRFVTIGNLVAIKIAPFNRYHTLDVIRAVVEMERADELALYTGNDDNIVNDLLTIFSFRNSKSHKLRIVGGLLGQWAFWTKKAVELLEEIHPLINSSKPIPQKLLSRGAQITDANGAIFDVRHNFAGCIPGIHEILRRQGLLEGCWCLNPKKNLSPGQIEEIDRVCSAYPHLNDNAFISKHLDAWMEGKIF